MLQYICVPVGALETNCYIVFDDKNQGFVVDPGGSPDRIISAIIQHDLNITHVLLTHAHFDHFLAAKEIIDYTGAKLYVPKGDLDFLSDPSKSLIRFAHSSEDVSLKADEVLEDGDEIKVGELDVKVLSTPGHTPGSSCFVCGSLLLSGDTLFAGSIGRTDFPGGDYSEIQRSLEKISDLEGDYTVLPGHGPQTTLDDERKGNPYMKSNGFDY